MPQSERPGQLTRRAFVKRVAALAAGAAAVSLVGHESTQTAYAAPARGRDLPTQLSDFPLQSANVVGNEVFGIVPADADSAREARLVRGSLSGDGSITFNTITNINPSSKVLAVSPDKQRIAYFGSQDGTQTPHWDEFINNFGSISLDGGETFSTIQDGDLVNVSKARWSEDGNYIFTNGGAMFEYPGFVDPRKNRILLFRYQTGRSVLSNDGYDHNSSFETQPLAIEAGYYSSFGHRWGEYSDQVAFDRFLFSPEHGIAETEFVELGQKIGESGTVIEQFRMPNGNLTLWVVGHAANKTDGGLLYASLAEVDLAQNRTLAFPLKPELYSELLTQHPRLAQGVLGIIDGLRDSDSSKGYLLTEAYKGLNLDAGQEVYPAIEVFDLGNPDSHQLLTPEGEFGVTNMPLSIDMITKNAQKALVLVTPKGVLTVDPKSGTTRKATLAL